MKNWVLYLWFYFQYAVEACKSVLLPYSMFHHRVTAEEAVRLAVLERVIQTDTWGTVSHWDHILLVANLSPYR